MKGSACQASGTHWQGWVPLIILPSLAVMTTFHLSAWLFMWALAIAIFAACKWFTWWEVSAAMADTAPPAPARSLAYLFLWPGMDARTFLDPESRPAQPSDREWLFAILKIIFSALLIWVVPQMIPPRLPLLRGWIGMTGLIFFLHFGTFHLLSVLWRKAGVNAEPIMQCPVVAKTVGEFWSKRWNRGFNNLVHDYIFEPLHGRLGVPQAMLLTFLASGLIHEAAISVPARAGYGLPTIYFLSQGAAILVQRSRFGRRAGLRRGVLGRVFTVFVVAAPAYWLFPPPFIRHVIIPFLLTIHSL